MSNAISHFHPPSIVFAAAVSLAVHLLLLAVPVGGVSYQKKTSDALSVFLSAPSSTQMSDATTVAERTPNHDLPTPSPSQASTSPPSTGPLPNTDKSKNPEQNASLDVAAMQHSGKSGNEQTSGISAPTAYFRLDELTVAPRMRGAPEIDTDVVTRSANKRGGIIALRFFVDSNGSIDDIHVLENSLPIEAKISIIQAFRAVNFSPGILKTNPVPSQLDYEIDIGNLNVARSRSSEGTLWSSGIKATEERGNTSQ